MSKKKKDRTIKNPPSENLRLNPEARLCEQFDSLSIKKFSAPDWTEMGFRVLDNTAEENVQS